MDEAPPAGLEHRFGGRGLPVQRGDGIRLFTQHGRRHRAVPGLGTSQRLPQIVRTIARQWPRIVRTAGWRMVDGEVATS
eukprot:7085116-Alexandrium_andersonii.AAC.1